MILVLTYEKLKPKNSNYTLNNIHNFTAPDDEDCDWHYIYTVDNHMMISAEACMDRSYDCVCGPDPGTWNEEHENVKKEVL